MNSDSDTRKLIESESADRARDAYLSNSRCYLAIAGGLIAAIGLWSKGAPNPFELVAVLGLIVSIFFGIIATDHGAQILARHAFSVNIPSEISTVADTSNCRQKQFLQLGVFLILCGFVLRSFWG